jgi:hypothetical protein
VGQIMWPVSSRHLGVALLLAGGCTQAFAQAPVAPGRQPDVKSLFGQAALPSPGNDVLGMRPETVGAVSYFPLAVDVDDVVRSRTGDTRSRLAIALPGGGSVTCLLDKEVRPDGLTTLTGTVVGEGPEARCDLVVDENGSISGDIDVTAGRYRVQPTGSGRTHAVAQVLTEAFPNESESPDSPDDGSSNRLTSEQMPPPSQQGLCDVKTDGPPKSFGPLRVMFLYTPAVKQNSPDIRKDIELLMLQLQRAFSATNLGGNFSVSVELAHAEEVNYSETATDAMGKDLDRLTNPDDPIFKRVHALRDTHKADIVHMLIRKRPDDGCGIGWTPPLPMRVTSARWGFSVSDYQCALAQFSAVHEIGHNLGMHHDRAVVKDAKPGPAQFNYGVVNVQQGVRSLMAYPDQCQAQKKNCRRLLIESSPRIMVGGAPFGRPLTEAGAAYNVEVLCRTAPIAVQFR